MFYKITDTDPLDLPIYGAEVLQPDDSRLFTLDQNLLQTQIDIEDQWLANAYKRREEELEALFEDFLNSANSKSYGDSSC